MFNDLNGQQNNQKPIDDIFAETDKPNNNSSSTQPDNIETHRVGLASLNDGSPLSAPNNNVQKPSLPWFKIVAIVIIAAIVILSGYLAYSKFFKSSTVAVVDTSSEKTSVVTPATSTNLVTPTTNENTATVVVPDSNTTVLPGSQATSTIAASTTPVSTVDSDSDGLTDAEEATYGTNPLLADTDGDGLSDYLEVKVYNTNPLVADTDGDGYPDGVEVKSGHNPNGPGMMPGLATTSATVK